MKGQWVKKVFATHCRWGQCGWSLGWYMEGGSSIALCMLIDLSFISFPSGLAITVNGFARVLQKAKY